MNNISKILIILGIICVINITNIIAQKNIEFDKANFPNQKDQLKQALRDISEGDKFYIINNNYYKNALPFYLNANKFNPNNALLNFKIGKCYLETPQKRNAIQYFEKSLKIDPNLSIIKKEIYYLLALAYHYNYEFDKAIDYYEKYKNTLSSKEIEEIEKTNKKIEECKYAKVLVKKPIRVFIDNLGQPINSKFPEYAPCINADESMMLFTACKDSTTGGGIDEIENVYFEDLYISYKVNGKWGKPFNPGKPMNTNTHDAAVALSPDGQKLIIYRGDVGNGDLYVCELKGDKWSKPEKMGKTINTDYHESFASFAPDGKTIYFSSNKPGGYGGHDLYYSKLNNKGKWEEPVNLGPIINTKYDEASIFVHPDGKTIYFSSNGHKTMGGHDIFKSVYENGKWSEPENIGYPINTPEDDRFLSISANGKHGYFASNREGGLGEHDIYLVTFLGPEKPVIMNSEDNLLASTEPITTTVIEKPVEIKTNDVTILKGRILDEKTKEPLYGQIEITDNEKNEIIATFESNSSTGKYLVSLPSGKNYGIAVKVPDYLFHSENIDIKKTSGYQELNKDIYMKRIIVGNKIILNNIFFDFDKATIRPESAVELERLANLLKEIPTLKIELSGHTDNVGSAEYNKKLSENRAKAVVEYLIVNFGIDKNRLTAKGYGFEQPIAPNDTEENRQLNRRTEFKILSK